MPEIIDIDSREEGVAGRLSNLTERGFIFDGILCRAIEGPLQAFKFSNAVTQQRICALYGRDAQKRGQEMNEEWKSQQILWWKGRKIPRESSDYQKLLDELYAVAFNLSDFQDDLIATGNAELIHSIGKNDPTDTVLTVYEFCSRLMNERRRLRRVRGILSAEEINDAAKKIELDGPDAFHAVGEMYGYQIARTLVVSYIRKQSGADRSYPPDPLIDKLVIETLKELQ